MEFCQKLPASECQPTDWVVGTTSAPNAISNQVIGQLVGKLLAGTTARPAATALPATLDFQRYARRVAFLRDSTGKLLADSKGYPIPLGIQGGSVKAFPSFNATINGLNVLAATTPPDSANNALWFRDTNNTNPYLSYPLGIADPSGLTHPQAGEVLVNNSGYVACQKAGNTCKDANGNTLTLNGQLNGQPLLVPVLQFQNTTNSGFPLATPTNAQGNNVIPTKWIQQATQTTFNLAAAAGDTPARANSTTQLFESNGGLYNFVRFLENWQNNTTARSSGSFIQLKRSAYATAPWGSVLPAPNLGPPTAVGTFGYPQGYRSGYSLLGFYYGWDYLPFYVAPNRVWGFDVALLSQSPDLFAQKLTLAPTSPPNEFFREVGRDDSWIQALLCAAQKDSTGKYSSYAVDSDQLPICPFNPSSNPPSYP